MLLEVQFTPAARAEFIEAEDWYGSKDEDLGSRFVASVQSAILLAQRRPRLYPVFWGEDVRRAIVRKFPYWVVYARRGPLLVVFAIWHTHRDPEEIARRLSEGS